MDFYAGGSGRDTVRKNCHKKTPHRLAKRMRICYNWFVSQPVQQGEMDWPREASGCFRKTDAVRPLPPERGKETRTPRAAHGAGEREDTS